MPNAAFTTLGCKVNQYETQKILESFESAGFDIVPFDSPADVYVINTCSVTSIAESKSRYAIRRARSRQPNSVIVATGCASEMASQRSEQLDGADVLVPNTDKLNALGYLLGAYPILEKQLTKRAAQTQIPVLRRTRATLKVQDGCNVYCSYCSIPYTRPAMVSRPASEVVTEATRLAEMGYQEVVLTGVLIGSYGKQTGSQGPDLRELIRQIHKETNIERIRVSSIEMQQVDDCLIELLKDGLVVPHLHIPLQSGDSGVLKDMNRPYDQDRYLRLCEKLYKSVPDLSITTDIMVGFPTETEDRFLSSVKVCKEVKFLKTHIFSFSPRFGTPADGRWGDPVPPQEKQRRRMVLSELTTATAQAQMQRYLGRTMRVLIEGKIGKDGLLEGLTDNYIPVKFAGSPSLTRQMANVTLEEVRSGFACGQLASKASPSPIKMLNQIIDGTP